jgi:hypothetical protein
LTRFELPLGNLWPAHIVRFQIESRTVGANDEVSH